MDFTEYSKAYRMGKKTYSKRLMQGKIPTLEVLDNILPDRGAYSEVPLGLVQIPIDQIVGTKTAGRSNSFAADFMPILELNTEFAMKWQSLCKSHEEEGIREPVKAYEYMNKFYILEGNKRVSVLKFYGVVSVPGNVIRLLPKRNGEKENNIYYEFIHFYDLSKVNYIWFSEEGRFEELQEAVGKKPDEAWSYDDKLEFSSVYTRFCNEYKEEGGQQLPITVGDAFLAFVKLHDYNTLDDMTTNELGELIKSSWEEFELLQNKSEVELVTEPNKKEKSLFSKLLSGSVTKLKVAFIYEKTKETSSWTYAHELGRQYLEETFPDEVSTIYYENTTLTNIEEVLQNAIDVGCNLIFTTTPIFAQSSVKFAIQYPKLQFLNCSLYTSHRYIRTYYSRFYEAKYIMGAIAGAMTENDKIGYVADYPILGTIANINAFALGVQLTNPRAKVYLDWFTKKESDPIKNLFDKNVSIISGKDMVVPENGVRDFGIFKFEDGELKNLAMPIRDWGKLYEQLIRTIIEGTFKYDDTKNRKKKAINYWWGMSAGIIDVICSQTLPAGTKKMADLLKKMIISGENTPFSGVIHSQTGTILENPYDELSLEEIVEMEWLAENIEGSIPGMEEFEEHVEPIVKQQGINLMKGQK